MSNDFEWVRTVLILFGGGAAGAIITILVNLYRNRIQPIGKQVRINSIFDPGNLSKDLFTEITLSGPNGTMRMSNLYLAQVEIQNLGNKDYNDFFFGLTLPDINKVVNLDTYGQDRHHSINCKQKVDFANPTKVLDFNLIPFNRNDKYTLSIYITSENGCVLEDIHFSTNLPVRFTNIPMFTGTFLEVLSQFLRKRIYISW